ncbi:S8 family serine peptidase [Rheinheimera sp.]|uniref:S8 family serine peptidase n=1 Tax=Rheinheimera sp. TaxID=1869214 RepID=UPI00307D4FAD
MRYLSLMLVLTTVTAHAQLNPLLNQLPVQLPVTLPEVRSLKPAALPQAELRELRQLRQQLQQQLDPLTHLPERLTLGIPGTQSLTEVQISPGQRAVEREWLMLLSAAQWQALKPVLSLPHRVRYLAALNLYQLTLQVSTEQDQAEQLRQLLPAELHLQLDRHYIYQLQQGAVNEAVPAPQPSTLSWLPLCNAPVSLGLVDSAVEPSHPALSSARIQSRRFLPATMAGSAAHGSAVASVLVGRYQQLQPLLPQAQLLVAEAFYQQNPYQHGATLDSLLQALDWLAGQQVSVINLSLTGPAHPALQQVVEQLSQQLVLVAAAGNAGPAAAPLYPAAYPQVLAVTAVDQHRTLYRWANQGDYIDFAAPGVKVWTAKAGGALSQQSGTSLASPVVAAFAACALQQGVPQPQLPDFLRQQATDLGEPGPDPQFGAGLLEPGKLVTQP